MIRISSAQRIFKKSLNVADKKDAIHERLSTSCCHISGGQVGKEGARKKDVAQGYSASRICGGRWRTFRQKTSGKSEASDQPQGVVEERGKFPNGIPVSPTGVRRGDSVSSVTVNQKSRGAATGQGGRVNSTVQSNMCGRYWYA